MNGSEDLKYGGANFYEILGKERRQKVKLDRHC
jgi:hypothetical protein